MRSESWESRASTTGKRLKSGHAAATALSCSSVCPDQLKSNSPRLMDEAVLALHNLARQCSDSSATEALTKHLFAILGGEQEVGTVGEQGGAGVAGSLLESAPGEAVDTDTSLHV